jgi:OOP family OmpA-OmpF porin
VSEGDPGTGSGDDLERLRRLLIGLDGDEFEALVRTIRDPGSRTSAVAEVISEAVAKRAASDESLGDTLAPTIEGALHRSIDRNPEPIANAIYPVIGPSVRKAITSALADLVTSLNRTVEQQFSPQALRWRFDAWREGLSYTEYLFANNINYSIDHVFLLHRETSLLLQHVAADAAFEADSDMVSSMLSAMATALTDFMHDSFKSDSEAARRSWSVDDRTIFVQAGEFAVAALVARGMPPAAKLADTSDFLDRAHVQYREALRDFEGDADVFAALRPPMEDLLRMTADADGTTGTGGSRPPAWPFALVSVVALALFAWWGWREASLGGEAGALRERLEATPGYVVLDSQRDGAEVRLTGLRDPLAPEFDGLAAREAPRLLVEGSFRPYFSAEPSIVEQRLLRDLAPPEGARAEIVDAVLVLSGVADDDWLERARVRAVGTEGVDALDTSGLVVVASPRARLEALVAEVERERLLFEAGEGALSDAQRDRLRSIAESIDATLTLGDTLGREVGFVVIGQSDSTGTLAVNRTVSRARADSVREALVAFGVDGSRLVSEPRIIGDVDAEARQVRFEFTERGTQ